MVEKEKEKIESKGAYAFDLHDGIRSVRRAIGSGNLESAHMNLESLFDLCAPEIRKAIKEEWDKIDRKFASEFKKIRDMDIFVAQGKLSGSSNADLVISVNSFVTDKTKRQIEYKKRTELKSRVFWKLVRLKFQAVIDCLDNHGELRKWREVDYGKL